MNILNNFNKKIKNKKVFYDTVYTPLSEAIKILEERQKDKSLIEKIEKLMDGDIPEPFKNIGKNGFQFRQIATPNFEGQWFIKIAQGYGLKSVFCEYHDDQFVSKNNFKLSLGQIKVYNGVNIKGEDIIEKINIIDTVNNDGKRLGEIKTHWKEPLVDFHRNLFDSYGLNNDLNFYDISDWFHRNGLHAGDYYYKMLLFFIVHGILFENFLITGTEKDFTQNIFLPAFKKIIKLTGLKPLIVPIPPMDIEYDEYVMYHPLIIKNIIKNKK